MRLVDIVLPYYLLSNVLKNNDMELDQYVLFNDPNTSFALTPLNVVIIILS